MRRRRFRVDGVVVGRSKSAIPMPRMRLRIPEIAVHDLWRSGRTMTTEDERSIAQPATAAGGTRATIAPRSIRPACRAGDATMPIAVRSRPAVAFLRHSPPPASVLAAHNCAGPAAKNAQEKSPRQIDPRHALEKSASPNPNQLCSTSPMDASSSGA